MKQTKDKRGQSLVELAISLLILLMLLSGAAEFGVIFFRYIELRDAAQEGALYASTHPLVADVAATGEVVKRVRNASDRPLDLTKPDVTVQIFVIPFGTATEVPSTNTTEYAKWDCEGNGIKVLVHYDHHIFMPFMSRWIGKTIPLNATVTDTILSPYSCTKDF